MDKLPFKGSDLFFIVVVTVLCVACIIKGFLLQDYYIVSTYSILIIAVVIVMTP